MIVSIMNLIEGYQIVDYCGIVVGEVIMGVNVVCDVFVSIIDIVGGWFGVYESKLQDVWDIVLCELEEWVMVKGVNVVVGVDLDYEVIG